MTTDSKPRIKITYATLGADNEDLHTQFEEGVAEMRANLGAYHRNYVNGEWRDGDGTFEVRTPIDRDIVLGTFARGTVADVDEAVAAARAAQPALAAVPCRGQGGIITPEVCRRAVAGAGRDHRPSGQPDQRAADGVRADHVDRGRQEPDRITRRGRGVRRHAALLLEDDGRQRRLRPRDGQPRRCVGPHELDPPAAWRVRGH